MTLRALILASLTLAAPTLRAEITPADIDHLLEEYFDVQTALAKDNLNGAQHAAGDLLRAAENIEDGELDELRRQAEAMEEADRIDISRRAFRIVSQEMIRLVKAIGTSSEDEAFLMSCPMAFGNMGAYWLQEEDSLRNPYYGAEMLTCGTQEGNIAHRQ